MMLDEDWHVLVSLFPENWREQAKETHALKGLRKNKSADDLLRTLLMHIAGGYSLRETAVRARRSRLADVSDVALLKRLRKCKGWLAALCASMFEDRGVSLKAPDGFEVRLLDATDVKEPGKTGSLWRIHYSIRIPSLGCDFFKVTGTDGEGTGESFKQFPIRAGDHLIADRGYATAKGIEYLSDKNGHVLVRMSPHILPVFDSSGRPLAWPERLREIKASGQAHSWPVQITATAGKFVSGRVCVVRKTKEAIRQTIKKLKRRASRRGQRLSPGSLLYAKYVIVFTTFPESSFTPADVMRWYRLRWQVELVFKRFKQIAQLGHLPKYDDESSKAWLYGKLFVALLTEKLIYYGRAISPWGSIWVEDATTESLS